MKIHHPKILIFIVVITGILAALYFVPLKRSFDSYTSRAEEAFQKKNFPHAIELYLKALRLYPDHSETPQVLLRIGDTYNFSLGNIEKASIAYDMLTSRFPKSDQAREGFQHSAEMFEKSDQYQKALLGYQGLIDNFPKHSDVDENRLNVARMALKLKKFEPARLTLMEIIEKNPMTPVADKVLYQLGNSFFMEGSPREAVQVLQLAVERYPESPLKTEMLFSLANAYEETGQLDRALKIYQGILSFYPNPKVIEKKIEKIQNRFSQRKEVGPKGMVETKKTTESSPELKIKSETKKKASILPKLEDLFFKEPAD